MLLPPNDQKELETAFVHLRAVNYHMFASTLMLLYDHILTFEQERIYIWNQRKGFPSLVFLVFRYFTPIASVINLVAKYDPHWRGTICRSYIWLPVACSLIISATTGVILILRVHAIYGRAMWILFITVPVYLTKIGIMAWSIPSGIPATNLPPGFGCVPVPAPGSGLRLPSIYIAALTFDTVVFALTIARAFYMRVKRQESITLLQIIVRDGTLYFMIIFVVNFATVFLLSFAPPDIRSINAPFASILTTLLVSRLVLNLREAATRKMSYDSAGVLDTFDPIQTYNPTSTLAFNKPAQPANTVASFIGFDEFDVPLDDFTHVAHTPWTSETIIGDSHNKAPEDLQMDRHANP